MIIDSLRKVGIATSDEDILQKNFMLYLGCAMSVGGIVWGTICLSLGLITQCVIPFSYALITFLNFCRFSQT